MKRFANAFRSFFDDVYRDDCIENPIWEIGDLFRKKFEIEWEFTSIGVDSIL